MLNPMYSMLCEAKIVEGIRLVAPSGEVYGGSDFRDTLKLAELQAVPLRTQEPAEGNRALGWEIVDDPENPPDPPNLPWGGKLERPTAEEPIPPPPPPPPPDLEALRQAQYDAVEAFANAGYDSFFRDWSILAMVNPATPAFVKARIQLMIAWSTNVWVAYKTTRDVILAGDATAFVDLKAIPAPPYTYWTIQVP